MKDATVGEILAEWARVGQTRVVNPEAIPRDRVTIELKDVGEDEALAILLRKASGYIAAPRAIALPDASRFDRILVMPPSVARMSVNTRPPAEVSAPPAGAPPDDEPPAEQAPPNAAPTYPTPAGQTPGNEGRAGRTTAHQAQPYAGDGQAGQADRAEQTEQVTQQPPPDTRLEDQALAKRMNRMQSRPTPPERPLSAGQIPCGRPRHHGITGSWRHYQRLMRAPSTRSRRRPRPRRPCRYRRRIRRRRRPSSSGGPPKPWTPARFTSRCRNRPSLRRSRSGGGQAGVTTPSTTKPGGPGVQ